MTVFLVRREYNMPSALEADQDPIMGIYATELAAIAAMTDFIEYAIEDGERVENHNDDEDDWTVCFHVESHEVKGLPAKAPEVTR